MTSNRWAYTCGGQLCRPDLSTSHLSDAQGIGRYHAQRERVGLVTADFEQNLLDEQRETARRLRIAFDNVPISLRRVGLFRIGIARRELVDGIITGNDDLTVGSRPSMAAAAMLSKMIAGRGLRGRRGSR